MEEIFEIFLIVIEETVVNLVFPLQFPFTYFIIPNKSRPLEIRPLGFKVE